MLLSETPFKNERKRSSSNIFYSSIQCSLNYCLYVVIFFWLMIIITIGISVFVLHHLNTANFVAVEGAFARAQNDNYVIPYNSSDDNISSTDDKVNIDQAVLLPTNESESNATLNRKREIAVQEIGYLYSYETSPRTSTAIKLNEYSLSSISSAASIIFTSMNSSSAARKISKIKSTKNVTTRGANKLNLTSTNFVMNTTDKRAKKVRMMTAEMDSSSVTFTNTNSTCICEINRIWTFPVANYRITFGLPATIYAYTTKKRNVAPWWMRSRSPNEHSSTKVNS